MSRDIKFSSFGIPYIPEFENVSFVPSSRSSSFCFIESPPPPPRLPPFSSLFRRKTSQPIRAPDHHVIDDVSKPLPPPPKPDVPEARGIYIRCPPEHSCPQMSRKQRLVHLQRTISIAVLEAGMSRSPANTIHPENHSSDGPTHWTRGCGSPDALFCGTYGQMMAALEAAGLSATPCVGEGHTRLGALFVARNDGASRVKLRKITLWG